MGFGGNTNLKIQTMKNGSKSISSSSSSSFQNHLRWKKVCAAQKLKRKTRKLLTHGPRRTYTKIRSSLLFGAQGEPQAYWSSNEGEEAWAPYKAKKHSLRKQNKCSLQKITKKKGQPRESSKCWDFWLRRTHKTHNIQAK